MSKIIILDPNLTNCISQDAILFNESLVKELEEYFPPIWVKNQNHILNINVSASDAVVVYNSQDNCIGDNIIELLEQAKKQECCIYPITVGKEHRKPPEVIEDKQSFDIHEKLRQRDFPKSAFSIIASELSRNIICDLQPTLSNNSMKCFLSHRRKDGEEIAAEIDSIFKSRAYSDFRDLIDIRVGENAQEVIEIELSVSDVVVFLDTPKAGESEWIEKELKLALSQNIPIVWVRLSQSGEVSNLRIKPADKPHFEYDFNTLDRNEQNELVDQIIKTAFKLHRQNAQKALNYVTMLKKLHRQNKITLEEVDTRKLIYAVTINRFHGRYPELPRRHLIQVHGKNPRLSDCEAFNSDIERCGYVFHPKLGHAFDAAVLVRPFPGKPEAMSNNTVVDGAQEYVNEIIRMTHSFENHKKVWKGIVISGSFPDVKDIYQQRIIDVVNTFARVILDRGFVLIFGGHPTFTPLILEMGRRRRGEAAKESIHLYQSRHFVKDEDVEEYEDRAQVFLTDIDGNRDKSLTKMRETMLMDKAACALVVIGGRVEENGYKPGVPEEVEIAQKNDIPVFIIGSTGGQAYKLASERRGWDRNGMQAEVNEKLMNGLDYEELADMVLTQLIG